MEVGLTGKWRMKAAVLAICVSPWLAAQGTTSSPALKEFQEKLADYLKVRESVQPKSEALKPTASQDAIKEHEKTLTSGLRQARAHARQGDIFTPPIAAEFRRLIRLNVKGSAAERVRTSIDRAEPVRMELRVNDSYPAGVPLPSTPPTLLLNLPPLPRELDYRVIGHDLVLRDTGANLIVDYLANAVP